MFRLFDFRCPCGQTWDDLVGAGEQSPCPYCGSPTDPAPVQMCQRTPEAWSVKGVTDTKRRYGGIGTPPMSSAQELDKWAESRGCHVATRDDVEKIQNRSVYDGLED